MKINNCVFLPGSQSNKIVLLVYCIQKKVFNIPRWRWHIDRKKCKTEQLFKCWQQCTFNSAEILPITINWKLFSISQFSGEQEKFIFNKNFPIWFIEWIWICRRGGLAAAACWLVSVSISIKDQSWARDNSVATIWQCYQATKLFVIAILLYLLWLPHLDTEA